MAEFARRKINFTAVKVNEQCNQMIDVMKKSYGGDMIVNDLAQACSTKSAAEVTKDFVAASSFILRATLGGGDAKSAKGAAALKKSAVKRGPALWDTKQFAVG
jgi:hypothetical protein